jgi:hypothetical protein
MQRHKLKARIERLAFGHLIKVMFCVEAQNISEVAALNRVLNCGSQENSEWHDAELQVPVRFVFGQEALLSLADTACFCAAVGVHFNEPWTIRAYRSNYKNYKQNKRRADF